MADKRYLLVLCTCPDRPAAERIANAVVGEGLAACVNILPEITSVYRWEGSLQCDAERLLIIKTRSDVYPPLETRIRALHPYQVPEVIALPIERGSSAYLGWLDGCLGDAP